jgi:hypothetical protein
VKRGGILARLARQSGVVVRGAPPAERASAPVATAPAGIEVETERVVMPAAAPAAPVVEQRAPYTSSIGGSRAVSPPVPAPALATAERARSLDDEAHPVVRVGEARSAPAAPVSADPVPRVIPSPPSIALPPQSRDLAYAIDEHVIAIAGEPEPLSHAPAVPAAAEAPRPAPQPSAPADRGPAAPPSARVARALAQARRWVAATPAPDEITRTVATGSMSEPAREGTAPLVVREQLVSVEPAAAPAMQELHVSIGKIEVVIDDPAPPAPAAARAPAPAAPARTPPPVRRWSRHYLRG